MFSQTSRKHVRSEVFTVGNILTVVFWVMMPCSKAIISRIGAIIPKVRGFVPGRGDEFLREIKIRSTPSFAGEVKQEAPSSKFLEHVKIHSKYEERY
jgi:hypothetical protein